MVTEAQKREGIRIRSRGPRERVMAVGSSFLHSFKHSQSGGADWVALTQWVKGRS